uniref:Uncharacterized protein n=1 Tax=Aegilops tauschii subsp. strangulata TaxID=200361 RepID=A0A452XST2_AEGTS
MHLEGMTLFTMTMVVMVVTATGFGTVITGFSLSIWRETNKVLSYNISTGELKEIRDHFERFQYHVYVPCYSKLPAQESSV